jgi:hypothetical protein
MVVLASVALRSGLAQSITVGPNVQVSAASPRDGHLEVFLAVDPNDGQRMIACSILEPPPATANQVVAYMSFDGGKTWALKQRAIPGYAITDPACAFGIDGSALLSMYGGPVGKLASTTVLRLYRSTDNGASWSPAPDKPFNLDPGFLLVDRTNSPYRGRIYLFGEQATQTLDNKRLGAVTVWRSVDGGATLTGPPRIVSGDERGIPFTGNGDLFPDGTLAIAVTDVEDERRYLGIVNPPEANAHVKVLMSSDGGDTFKTVTVSDAFVRPFATVNATPVLAIDHSSGAFKDRLYVAWVDVRSHRAEILFSYSSDRGKTWVPPVSVNDDVVNRPGPGPDDFMPTITVNKDGVLGIGWYDRREAKDNLGWRARFAASVDGGDTFTPSIAVAQEMMSVGPVKNLPLISWSYGEINHERPATSPIETEISLDRGPFIGGDYAGLAAGPDGVFHPLWVDNRAGVPQMWTAPVTVTGSAVQNGSAELAAYEDLSLKTTVDLADILYDPGSNILTAKLGVANVSKEAIRGTMVLRVLGLSSEFGDPEIINADNKEHRSGARFDLTLEPGKTELAPGQRTQLRDLKLHFAHARPVSPTTPVTAVTSIVKLRSKFLVKP